MKQEKQLSRIAGIYCGVALGLSALSALLRCINLKFFFDAPIGYFQSGAPLPLAADLLAVVSVIAFALIPLLYFRGCAPVCPSLPSLVSRVGGAIAAAAFLLLAAAQILGSEVWGGILALGAGLYFATVLSKTPLPPLFRLLCALCVILRLLMLLADSYFDITVQMNASHKLALHLACLGGMMMTVCDVRALLGKPRPILFPFSLATAVLLTGGYALPNLLDAYTGALGAADPLTTAPEAIALLAIALYSALRLIGLARAPRTCPETVEEIPAEEAAEKIPTEEASAEEIPTEETAEEPADEPTPEQET